MCQNDNYRKGDTNAEDGIRTIGMKGCEYMYKFVSSDSIEYSTSS